MMTISGLLFLAAIVFLACVLVDKGYAALFRNKVQHQSGLSVRVDKRNAIFGLILTLLGILSLLYGDEGGSVLTLGGFVVLIMGVGLIVRYMSFGVFYDGDSFVYTTFGKRSVTYRYSDIVSQQLYLIQGGSIVIELHMTNGRSVSLQSTMDGVYTFLDHAFHGWCRQTGHNSEECTFYDPANSIWFPQEES